MRDRRSRFVATFVALALGALSGCAAMAGKHDGKSAACIGIPGDLVNPNATAATAPTHGPGISSPAPLRLAATGGPPYRHAHIMSSIPMLYAYNDKGGFAMDLVHVDAALTGPLFAQAAQRGFWGEIESGRYWSIPWFSTCDQADVLGSDFVFRGPPHGILLVQYRLQDCAACDRIDAAIEQTIATHPDTAFRWVQFDLGSTQATSAWCYDDLSLGLRENWNSRMTEEFTCHR